MRDHLVPSNGGDTAISYALEVLIRARATLDTVFQDHPKDLRDPARKPYLRRQFEELGCAIEELRRLRAGS